MNKLACLAILSLFGFATSSKYACTSDLTSSTCQASSSDPYACGSDGLVYYDKCKACQTAGVKYYEDCPTNGAKMFACTPDLKSSTCQASSSDPYACGMGGLTYYDKCKACQSGSPYYISGQCSTTNNKFACTPDLKSSTCQVSSTDPYACAIDGLTYYDKCKACQSGSPYYVSGQCSTTNNKFACTADLKSSTCQASSSDPYACGKDGLTYYDKCKACQSGSPYYISGQCSSTNNKFACTSDLTSSTCQASSSDPYACGSDGLTYNDKCKACQNAGHYYISGKCA